MDHEDLRFISQLARVLLVQHVIGHGDVGRSGFNMGRILASSDMGSFDCKHPTKALDFDNFLSISTRIDN